MYHGATGGWTAPRRVGELFDLRRGATACATGARDAARTGREDSHSPHFLGSAWLPEDPSALIRFARHREGPTWGSADWTYSSSPRCWMSWTQCSRSERAAR